MRLAVSSSRSWCGRRFRQYRIKPDLRRSLHDQDPHQVVDVVGEVGAGIETCGDKTRMHRIHQLLSR